VVDFAVISVPRRDPRRPQDDPWDADAVRHVEQFTSRSRGWIMEHGRAQERLTSAGVSEARSLFNEAGVRIVPEPRGRRTINRFYRTDPDAPAYPDSPEHRQWLLRFHG
jgi:hypothetical protein